MKNKIYLAGSISFKNKETYNWRASLQERFKGLDNFEIFNPCINEFNLDGNGSGKKIEKTYDTENISVLVPKDKTFVLKSTMAIVNLNTYDPSKPSIGTMFELAWYNDNPEKTVIGIFDGDPKEDKVAGHPFIQQTVTTWVQNEEEAFNVVMRYFND